MMLGLLVFLLPTVSCLDVLWIGNSYTYVNDVPKTVQRMAQAAGETLHYDQHTEGGWSWERHAASQETTDKIAARQWDVVVLQEYSTRPADDAICSISEPYLEILVERIRANNPDTIIQFYLTWGRPYGESNLCKTQSQYCTYLDMQAQLTKHYNTYACMNKPSRVAPVGKAFKSIYDSDETYFYHLYNEEGVTDHHASPRGSYLSALVHFGSLFNRSVVGNTETAGLHQQDVNLLQDTAQAMLDSKDWNYPVGDECDLCICKCN